MIGDHWYACVAELTEGQRRWDVARDRCRERHRMYGALGAITKGIQMSMSDTNTSSVAEPGVGSTIVTGEGVKEAGPDIPALAAATQREEDGRAAAMQAVSREAQIEQWEGYAQRCLAEGVSPMSFETWSRTITGGRPPYPKNQSGLNWSDLSEADVAKLSPAHVGGPVGRVSPEQAGILPTGGIQVTDAMVYRAQTELARAENPFGASAVRAALKAALTG